MTEKIINHENNSAPISNTLYRHASGNNTVIICTLDIKPFIYLPLVPLKTHDVTIQVTPPNERNLIAKRKERISHYVQAVA